MNEHYMLTLIQQTSIMYSININNALTEKHLIRI